MKHSLALSTLAFLLGCAPHADQLHGMRVEKVAYRSGSDTVQALLYHPADSRRRPGLLVVHGDYGLTDWVKEQGKRLAGKGCVVLEVDLYRGAVVTDLMDAHILGRGLPDDQVLADLRAAADYMISRPEVRSDALGIIGWDMGGGYALDGAIHDPRLRAAVVCYGRLTTDAQQLAPLRASVLGIFAGQDEGISPETIEQFRAAMEKAGKRVAGIYAYPSCRHGFMDPASPNDSGPPASEAIASAWSRIDAYLAAELQP